MKNITQKELVDSISFIDKLKSVQQNAFITDELIALKQKLNDTSFRIAVVGEFRSGKSTFINAFIGQDILKHAVDETTATITYITNVDKNDCRNGTCEVYLHSGKKITLPNFERLAEFTTAQSNQNVADNVKSTHIYLHFLDVNYPVIIVDTPGLNGLADKHREMTIEEIKKAHACIYVCSIRGLSLSDIDFIQNLLQYQSQFIFIQNFIDQLRAGEGETVQGKLDMMKKILIEKIQTDDLNFDYELCGVSALKALVGHDKSIRFLYNSDTAEITEKQRMQLYNESNFHQFLQILENFIKTGKYKKIILSSVQQTLITITEMIAPTIEQEQRYNELLILHDSRQAVCEAAKQQLEKLEFSYEKNRKKLEDFITSEDVDNRRELKRFVHEKLILINERLIKMIDAELGTYEDYEKKSNNQNLGLYFSKKVTELVNTDLLPELNMYIQDCFSRLYHDALLRAGKYVSIKQENSKINIQVVSEKEKISLSDKTLKQQIQTSEQELLHNKQQIKDLNAKIHSDQQSLSTKSRDMASRERTLSSEIQKLEMQRSALGARPSAAVRTVTRTREVKRGGIVGWFKDLFSTKKETYQEKEYDYSNVERWERESKRLMDTINAKRLELDKEINAQQRVCDSLSEALSRDSRQRDLLEKKIRSLEESIQAKKEEHEKAVKYAKTEFLNQQKKKLIMLFEDYLTSKQEGLYIQMQLYIDRNSEKHVPKIKQMVLEQFENSHKQICQNLIALQTENTEKLQQMYTASQQDALILKRIRNTLGADD